MTEPKLHHYVPQFYLRRFKGTNDRLWIWDKGNDRVFTTGPGSIAAETNFYYLSELAEAGHDPMTMEKQLAHIEAKVSAITGQWLDWIRECGPGDRLVVPEINREIVSLFLTLQILRTADARSILTTFANSFGHNVEADSERRAFHTALLWDEQIVSKFAARIGSSTWVFGQNRTSTPFVISDNPVALRTSDSRMWLSPVLLRAGTYMVYPLAPDAVMYCYPDEDPWRSSQISRFDCRISPAVFTDELVHSDNTGQVFTASRFVISNRADFARERLFAETIGTDALAPSDSPLD